MAQNKLAYYRMPKQRVPTYAQFLDQLKAQRKDNIRRQHYTNAIDKIHDTIIEYLEDQGLSENQEVSKGFIDYADTGATEAYRSSKFLKEAACMPGQPPETRS